jgi:hypothetical protein
MKVKAGACCSANRRTASNQKRCSTAVFPAQISSLSRHANIAPITKGKQLEEHQRVDDSLRQKRNIMIGNCPVKRLMENALLPKHNRHKTEDCENPAVSMPA